MSIKKDTQSGCLGSSFLGTLLTLVGYSVRLFFPSSFSDPAPYSDYPSRSPFGLYRTGMRRLTAARPGVISVRETIRALELAR